MEFMERLKNTKKRDEQTSWKAKAIYNLAYCPVITTDANWTVTLFCSQHHDNGR